MGSQCDTCIVKLWKPTRRRCRTQHATRLSFAYWTGSLSSGTTSTLSWRSTAPQTSSQVRDSGHTVKEHNLVRSMKSVNLKLCLPCRSLLLPVLPSISGRVQAMVHRSVEPLHHTVPAGGSQRWHQGEIHCQCYWQKVCCCASSCYSKKYFCVFSQVHGHKAVWEDPVEWVRGTLPWPNAQQDQSKLFHLPPPSIGPPSEEKKPPKDTPPPSTLESDPLVREKVSIAIVRCREAAWV